MGQSNADEDMPSIGDIDIAERLGARVAVITRRIKSGVAFETGRSMTPTQIIPICMAKMESWKDVLPGEDSSCVCAVHKHCEL